MRLLVLILALSLSPEAFAKPSSRVEARLGELLARFEPGKPAVPVVEALRKAHAVTREKGTAVFFTLPPDVVEGYVVVEDGVVVGSNVNVEVGDAAAAIKLMGGVVERRAKPIYVNDDRTIFVTSGFKVIVHTSDKHPGQLCMTLQLERPEPPPNAAQLAEVARQERSQVRERAYFDRSMQLAGENAPLWELRDVLMRILDAAAIYGTLKGASAWCEKQEFVVRHLDDGRVACGPADGALVTVASDKKGFLRASEITLPFESEKTGRVALQLVIEWLDRDGSDTACEGDRCTRSHTRIELVAGTPNHLKIVQSLLEAGSK